MSADLPPATTSRVPPERTCFVISPIGDDDSEVRRRSDLFLNYIVRQAAEPHHLTVVRSDHISEPGIISSQIIEHMLRDAIVVADLTDHNANVFYELALRHAFHKPVIQLIMSGQQIPFYGAPLRTIQYGLTIPEAFRAMEQLRQQIGAALATDFQIDSPVAHAASLDALRHTEPPQLDTMVQNVLEQVQSLANAVADVRQSLSQSDEVANSIPGYVQERMDDIIRRYSREIEVLQYVRQAGVIGIFKRRESAIRSFSRYIDEESREIVVVGSSLKGLLQNEEYAYIARKLFFKQGLVRVKFLLTHPIMADFRAKQESRPMTEIGREIVRSLELLRTEGTRPHNVRLYLGAPTCFAIKTSTRMLINPYPYASVSFDSPCMLLEYAPEAGIDRQSYFFDEFNARHFGAWDTELAVQISDFDSVISSCNARIDEWSRLADDVMRRGKNFE